MLQEREKIPLSQSWSADLGNTAMHLSTPSCIVATASRNSEASLLWELSFCGREVGATLLPFLAGCDKNLRQSM